MTIPLPPLPPVPGEHATTGRSVVDVLADEHAALDQLCARMLDPAAAQRRDVAEVVTAALARHLSAEEQYLYPTVRAAAADGAELADREIAEDRAMLLALDQLRATAPDDPDFDRLAGTVRAGLRRHAAAAHGALFPRLRSAATDDELVRLGNRVILAAEAGPTRPHPATPSSPPWNKVIDPAVGLVDRVRDAVERRPTRPGKL